MKLMTIAMNRTYCAEDDDDKKNDSNNK